MMLGDKVTQEQLLELLLKVREIGEQHESLHPSELIEEIRTQLQHYVRLEEVT